MRQISSTMQRRLGMQTSHPSSGLTPPIAHKISSAVSPLNTMRFIKSMSSLPTLAVFERSLSISCGRASCHTEKTIWERPAGNDMAARGVQRVEKPPILCRQARRFYSHPVSPSHEVTCVSDEACMILLYSESLWDMHFVDASGKEISVDEAVAAAAKERLK